MSTLHESQISVLTALLSHTHSSRIHIVAGLHSGRPCVQGFFKLCEGAGLEIVNAEEVDRSPEGLPGKIWDHSYLSSTTHRENDETEMERRRWLLIAELRWTEKASEQVSTSAS